MDLSQRLRQLIDNKSITPYEVSIKTGISQSTLSRILNNSTTKINIKNTNLLARFFGINESWLLTGDGDKERSVGLNSSEGVAVYTIPLLPISAQGGSLSDFLISVTRSDCEQIISPIRGVDFAITISGESMAPDYPNGSQILIKKINEKAFIEWGKVFVLDTCNGTVIKIIAPSTKKGYLRCLSINPNPIFAPFDISLDDIYGIYRVLFCMLIK